MTSQSPTTATASPPSTEEGGEEENQKIKEMLDYKMKNGEAVLFEVGKLGKEYQDWVHTVRVNKMLRFFENDTLELTSYCPWWTVPMVWGTVVLYLVWNTALGPLDTLKYFVLGFSGWPPLEYVLHRYLFHMHTETYWWNTFHFIIHGNHHVSPNDHLRLVFPPVPASFIVLIIGSMILNVFGNDVGYVIIPGMMFGYVCYDMVHFSIHSPHTPKFIVAALKPLKIHHSKHHRAIDSEFGITTMFIDNLLGSTEEIVKGPQKQ